MNVVLRNIRGLLLLQLVSYVLPLVVIPYVFRAIGPIYTGKVNFSQSYINYFLLLINYGFDITGTKRISVVKDKPKELVETFNEIISTKIFLFVISTVVFLICTLSIPTLRSEFALHFYSFSFCLGWVFFPTWFFHGIQEIQTAALIALCFKLVSSIAIFFVVNNVESFYWFNILTSLGQILAGLWAFYLAMKRYNISFYFIKIQRIIELLIEERFYFVSTIVVNLYTTTNVFLIGFLLDDRSVGIYSAAVRLITIVVTVCINPISQSIFPEIANKMNANLQKGLELVQNIIPVVFFITVLGTVFLYVVAPFIVSFIFGEKFVDSIGVFQYLCIIPILSSLSLFQAHTMLSLKLDRYILNITLIAGIVSVAINLIFINLLQYYASVLAYVSVEAFILVAGYFVLRYKGLTVIVFDNFSAKSFRYLIKNFNLFGNKSAEN
ncbi:oligosaccharide flippase family protein [Arcicella sp. DC2W]|uniref:Oligosaccharide flippase family protein n=1 Tax=Arcicella gelida TaxID=2984195 RepID=A0ABU5S6D5_9BACT|nr:oligosaccharide flippase family protein [Arcicella sp. DC2W]MEA5404033.1 oligosaccharide flippase family protein [Arcicella sp. DC2W]